MSTKPLNQSTEINIASLLVSLTRSMYRTMRSVAPTCSFLEMKTLTFAYEQKNPTMKDIADEVGIYSPAMTAVVDKLVESGDLTRLEDKNDRRVIRISLTTVGKKTFEKNRETIYKAFNSRTSVLTVSERDELARILTKLQNN